MGGSVGVAWVRNVVVTGQDSREGVCHLQLTVEGTRLVTVRREVTFMLWVFHRWWFVIVRAVIQGTWLPVLWNSAILKKWTASLLSDGVTLSHLIVIDLLCHFWGATQGILIFKIKNHLSSPELLIIALLEFVLYARLLQRLIRVDGSCCMIGLGHIRLGPLLHVFFVNNIIYNLSVIFRTWRKLSNKCQNQ